MLISRRRTASRIASGFSVAAIGVLGAPALAAAGSFTAPSGLAAGSFYRLVFVTSTTITGSSTTIGDYNAAATGAAALNTALPATTWAAIASTAATDAATNIACGAGCAADPLFLVNGSEVAVTLADFFAGTVMNPIAVDEAGAVVANGGTQGPYVWTGSNADGTGATGAALGTTDPVTGNPYGTGNGLTTGFTTSLSTSLLPLYAISAPIEVSNAPEPASFPLLLAGTVLLGTFRRRRPSA